MNARSKADFINSVAGGMIPCPNCQKLNEPDSKFCEACGTRLVKPEEPKPEATPAFEPVKKEEPVPAFEPVKKVEPAPAFEPVKKTEIKQEVVYHEPESVFAKGLPDWDMVPPQVMVRRKKR